MENINTLLSYFPDLSQKQQEQFARMPELYADWNSKINVISRKDIDNIFTNHILHSLVIAAFLGPLASGTKLMDLGCGGGFPGIPLAVMYPQCRFHLIDRIAKKILVARNVAQELGLTNVTFQHGDAGECHDRYDYVVSRAVMALEPLVKIAARNVVKSSELENRYSPGLVCLKGGDLEQEIKAVNRPVISYPVSEFFKEPFFQTKELIYVPL